MVARLSRPARDTLAGWAAAAALCLTLVGCGGGGGGDNGTHDITVGGRVTGLAGTLVLGNRGGDTLTLGSDGRFDFAEALAPGQAYEVVVLVQPETQWCTVARGSGLANTRVDDITVRCEAAHALALTTRGDGQVRRDPDQPRYAAGTRVRLTAVPQAGQRFLAWGGALVGTTNPAELTIDGAIEVRADFVPATHTLTVQRAGQGNGRVSGRGIDCGIDCDEPCAAGIQVLAASASAGSRFVRWEGCDSSVASFCTVNINTDRSVRAVFEPAPAVAAPVVSLPASSRSGDFTLTVDCAAGGGSCAGGFLLQEASDAAFAAPLQSWRAGTGDPTLLAVAGKPAGTWCYRAAVAAPDWGEAACITVSPPGTAVLRIENRSSYDLVDLRLDGVQQLRAPGFVAAGGAAEFVFNGAGTVAVEMGNGFYRPDASRDLWFMRSDSATLAPDATTTLAFDNPGIGELLGSRGGERVWDGLSYDAALNPWHSQLRIDHGGGWQSFASQAPCLAPSDCRFANVASGTLRLLAWPAHAGLVAFDFGPGSAATAVAPPFDRFSVRSGSVGWPVIDYAAQ